MYENELKAVYEGPRLNALTSLNFYVYQWPSIHCLYFIYARKIYVRTHVNPQSSSRTQRSVLGLCDTTTCTGGPCHRLFSLSKFLLWNGIRRLPKTDFESYQPSDQKSSSWKFIFFIVNHYVVRIFVCVRLFRRRFFSRYLTDFSQKCLLYPSVDGLDIDEVVIWEKLLKKEKRFVEREKSLYLKYVRVR